MVEMDVLAFGGNAMFPREVRTAVTVEKVGM
jgi:hypothetical protein